MGLGFRGSGFRVQQAELPTATVPDDRDIYLPRTPTWAIRHM